MDRILSFLKIYQRVLIKIKISRNEFVEIFHKNVESGNSSDIDFAKLNDSTDKKFIGEIDNEKIKLRKSKRDFSSDRISGSEFIGTVKKDGEYIIIDGYSKLKNWLIIYWYSIMTVLMIVFFIYDWRIGIAMLLVPIVLYDMTDMVTGKTKNMIIGDFYEIFENFDISTNK